MIEDVVKILKGEDLMDMVILKEEVEGFLETILSVTNILTRVESYLNSLKEDNKHLKDIIGLLMLNKKVWDHMFMSMRNQKKRNY